MLGFHQHNLERREERAVEASGTAPTSEDLTHVAQAHEPKQKAPLCPRHPAPTILGELCGANEGGNLKTVLCAVLAGGKGHLVFGCLELLFLHLQLGPRQCQVEFCIFHFLVVTLRKKHVRHQTTGNISCVNGDQVQSDMALSLYTHGSLQLRHCDICARSNFS